MGNVIRGKDMAITGESTTDYFEIHTERTLADMVAGNTDGGVMREDGNDRWWGFYRLYGHSPARFPNNSFTFVCAPENAGNIAVSGTAKCSAIRIAIDIRNGEYIDSVVSFLCHGALSTSVAAPTDVSQPLPLSVKGLYPEFGATSYQNYHIDYMQLDIQAAGMDQYWYADSTSNGQVMHEDGDIDAKAEFRMLTDSSADFPTIGSRQIYKMRVTATTYWELAWMRVRGVLPWRTDRRRKELVGAAIQLEFSGWSGTMQGYIKNPATTLKWGSA